MKNPFFRLGGERRETTALPLNGDTRLKTALYHHPIGVFLENPTHTLCETFDSSPLAQRVGWVVR